jgi:hypothetical protein
MKEMTNDQAPMTNQRPNAQSRKYLGIGHLIIDWPLGFGH